MLFTTNYEGISTLENYGSFIKKMYALHKLQLPLPPSFIILPSAFHNFLEESNLKNKINQLLNNLNYEDQENLQNKANQIQKLILSSVFPTELKKQVSESYSILNDNTPNGNLDLMNLDHGCTMAVKSEFLAINKEKTVQAPTYLHVQGIEQLYTAIKSCFASYYTAQLISNRINNNDSEGIILIVQKMIFPEKSGVVTPAQNNPESESVISACIGLPELINEQIDGYDTYLFDTNTKILSPFEIQTQKYTYLRDKRLKKIVRKKIYEHESSNKKLSDSDLNLLSNILPKLSTIMTKESEIKFMIENRKLYFINHHTKEQEQQNGSLTGQPDETQPKTTNEESTPQQDELFIPLEIPQSNESQARQEPQDYGVNISDLFDSEQPPLTNNPQPEQAQTSVSETREPNLFPLFSYDTPKSNQENSELHELMSNTYFSMSSIVLACNLAIEKAVQSKYKSLFQEPPSSLEDAIDTLIEREYLPQDTKEILSLKNKIIENPQNTQDISMDNLINKTREIIRNLIK